MIRRYLCNEYLREIERLERSIRELEEEIIELRMQLRQKTDEATSLSIENASLRYKLELLRRREERLIKLFRELKIPLVVVDEEEFEDVEVDLKPDTGE